MLDCFILANELGYSTGKKGGIIRRELRALCVTAAGENMSAGGRVSLLTLGLYAVLLLSPVAGEPFQQ